MAGSEAESAYPFSVATPLAFVASSKGLLPYTGGLPPESGRMVLTASQKGKPGILAAIGDYGVLLLEPSPTGASFRLRAFPSRDVEGLDPGGAWPSADGFLVQFFRNPLSPAKASAFGPRLFAFSEAGLEALSPEVLKSAVNQAEELFALFPDPRSPGAWLAQLRSSEAGDSANSRFLAMKDLESSSVPLVPLERQAFETILRPRPISGDTAMPEAGLLKGLSAAALRIGGSDFILRLRNAHGGESYWAKGSADQALSLEAWSGAAGNFLLESSGAAVFFPAGQAAERELRLEPPLPGAKFGSVVIISLAEGVLVSAVWEADGGQSSGLLVFRL